MDDDDQIAKLNAIVDRFFERPPPRGLFDYIAPPFDVSKPNKHDSKAEFLREIQAVEDSIEHIEGLFAILLPAEGSSEYDAAFCHELRNSIDELAVKHAKRKRPDTVAAFLNRSAIDTGLTLVTLHCLIDMHTALSEQQRELADQFAEFWDVSNRPPNHYARQIALRFARLIARNTGKKPTFGIARDGNYPSTEFGRALEEVFEILGIRAHVKNAATWALNQLTEDDCKPVGNALAMIDSHSHNQHSSSETIREIAHLLAQKARLK